MTTLDDLERTLDEDVCLIADDEGPTSIAGLMGGQRSEVSETTTRVLMEAANWDGPNLQRSSARLGLRTEASGPLREEPRARAGARGPGARDPVDDRGLRARLVPGTIDEGGPRARSPRCSGCGPPGSSGCSAQR
jgi:phenylalanyl-tRNA synthetase beta chain